MIKEKCFICDFEEIPKDLHKHHVDWNHNNNAPENIVILCKRCHVIIHQTHYVSKDEMLELRKKILSYKNDPFAPKWGLYRLVFCLHCGDVYPESQAKWDAEREMWWCKNCPECDGAGIGFDLIPEDEMSEGGSQTGGV